LTEFVGSLYLGKTLHQFGNKKEKSIFSSAEEIGRHQVFHFKKRRIFEKVCSTLFLSGKNFWEVFFSQKNLEIVFFLF